jgi:predicted RNase H-like HicB family nuclease
MERWTGGNYCMPSVNYRVTVTFDPARQLFIARTPELAHCMAEGASRSEAIQKMEEEIAAQLRNMAEAGRTPPAAVDDEQPAAPVPLNLTSYLRRELQFQARSEGVELDQLASEILAAGLEARRATRGQGALRSAQPSGNQRQPGAESEGFRGRPGRGFSQGRYANPALLDDRASFMEYVRGLEGGNGVHADGGAGANGRGRRRRRGGPGGPGGGRGPSNGGPGGGHKPSGGGSAA